MPTPPTTQAADEAASLSPAERRRQHGLKAIRKRWGPQRVVRLDSLTPAEREAVVALIEHLRAANEKAAAGGLQSGDGPSGGRDRGVATTAD